MRKIYVWEEVQHENHEKFFVDGNINWMYVPIIQKWVWVLTTLKYVGLLFLFSLLWICFLSPHRQQPSASERKSFLIFISIPEDCEEEDTASNPSLVLFLSKCFNRNLQNSSEYD